MAHRLRGADLASGSDEVPASEVATARAEDSRYAQIVGVLRDAEQRRPPMRRLADRLGGWYTALALTPGVVGWLVSGDRSGSSPWW